MNKRYCLYRAYFFYLQGLPIPVDLFMDLLGHGIAPEALTRAFDDGLEPPFSDGDIKNFAIDEYVEDNSDEYEEEAGDDHADCLGLFIGVAFDGGM